MRLADATDAARFCETCGHREEPGDLDAAGLCPPCQLQKHVDNADWALARETCDAYGLKTPDALGLHELDREIAARQAADRDEQIAG